MLEDKPYKFENPSHMYNWFTQKVFGKDFLELNEAEKQEFISNSYTQSSLEFWAKRLIRNNLITQKVFGKNWYELYEYQKDEFFRHLRKGDLVNWSLKVETIRKQNEV